MAFGKLGRPPEDRLARQHEIYVAVSPLIVQGGARQLSMRQAARAVSLSIGGLYYYFPTKRELLLHGLCPAALLRFCQEFHAEFDYLTETDPRRYLEEGIAVIVQQAEFCRPSIQAALELGAESLWEVVETLLASTLFWAARLAFAACASPYFSPLCVDKNTLRACRFDRGEHLERGDGGRRNHLERAGKEKALVELIPEIGRLGTSIHGWFSLVHLPCQVCYGFLRPARNSGHTRSNCAYLGTLIPFTVV